MVKKTIAIILCVMLFITGMPLTIFGAERISAKLIQMDGDVQIIRAGGEKPFKAFVNMRLTEGDRIITGPSGKAKVQMDDEVIITLAENTRVYLSELRGSNGAKQSSISLQSGGIGSTVKEKLKDNSRFEIKTPTAVMGVRGTEFFTQYYNGNVDVRVVDGVVEIRVNVGSDGKVTGSEEEATMTYTFPIEALQQVGFNEGEVAEEIDDKVEDLDLDGLPVPFLDRIKEIKREAPEAIPEEIMEEIDKAVENAIKKLIEKMENTDLVPDEIASSLETMIAGNIQETAPTVKTPPPKPDPDTDSTSSRRDRDRDDDRGGDSSPSTVAVESVEISPSEVNITVGATKSLIATVYPENATDKTVTWSSDKLEIATVDSNGKVTANAVGTAKITAKAGGKTSTCSVIVASGDKIIYQFEDEEDLEKAEYIDIISGSVKFVGDKVTLVMQLREIPETLPYNRSDEQIEIGDIEYHWGMEIDIDENTAYKLGILYVKKEGPEENAGIENFAEGEIWELVERRPNGGSTWHTIDGAEFEVDDSLNTIKIIGIIEDLANKDIERIGVYALDHGCGDRFDVSMESDGQEEMCKLTLCGGGGILYSEYEGKDATYTTAGYYMPYASECTVEYIPKGTEVKINIMPPSDDCTRIALLINDELKVYDEEDYDRWQCIEGTHVYYTYTFTIEEDTEIKGIFDKYQVTFDEYQVTFAPSGVGNGTVKARYSTEMDEFWYVNPEGMDDIEENIESGELVELKEGTFFIFKAKPEDDYKVEKWTINGKELEPITIEEEDEEFAFAAYNLNGFLTLALGYEEVLFLIIVGNMEDMEGMEDIENIEDVIGDIIGDIIGKEVEIVGIKEIDDVNVEVEFEDKPEPEPESEPEFNIYYNNDEENPEELIFNNKLFNRLIFNLKSDIDNIGYEVTVSNGESGFLRHKLIKRSKEWKLKVVVWGYGEWVINISGYNDDDFIGLREIIILINSPA